MPPLGSGESHVLGWRHESTCLASEWGGRSTQCCARPLHSMAVSLQGPGMGQRCFRQHPRNDLLIEDLHVLCDQEPTSARSSDDRGCRPLHSVHADHGTEARSPGLHRLAQQALLGQSWGAAPSAGTPEFCCMCLEALGRSSPHGRLVRGGRDPPLSTFNNHTCQRPSCRSCVCPLDKDNCPYTCQRPTYRS